MHVGSVLVFEGPAPAYDDFVAHIERGLHLVPALPPAARVPAVRRLAPGVGRRPALQRRLPRAPHGAAGARGRGRSCARLAGRVFSQQLDREKPLWEIWLVDELGDGRFALICKTHHALVDGISGVDIMTVLFDLGPGPAGARARRRRGRRGRCPGGAELLATALGGAGERAVRVAARRARAPGPRRRGRRPRGRRDGGDGRRGDRGRAAEPAERADRAAPAVRVGLGRPGDVQGDQGRAGRHDQRRRADRGHGRAARAPVPPRARPRRARAEGDGADLRARRRRARRARQPGRGDVRAAAGRARGPGRALSASSTAR